MPKTCSWQLNSKVHLKTSSNKQRRPKTMPKTCSWQLNGKVHSKTSSNKAYKRYQTMPKTCSWQLNSKVHLKTSSNKQRMPNTMPNNAKDMLLEAQQQGSLEDFIKQAKNAKHDAKQCQRHAAGSSTARFT